jgi:hypothetical protein
LHKFTIKPQKTCNKTFEEDILSHKPSSNNTRIHLQTKKSSPKTSHKPLFAQEKEGQNVLEMKRTLQVMSYQNENDLPLFIEETQV